MNAYRQLSPELRAEVLDHRRLQGFPLHSPPHRYDASGWFLVTGVTYEHQMHFATPADREWLLGEILKELDAVAVQCSAWVVLPNHYHLLVACSGLGSVARVTQRVHGRTSRELNRREGIEGRRIWYRYADRQIRSERHYLTTVNYIHFNPVKHGHVEHPLEWGPTSVHWYHEHFGSVWLESVWNEYPLRAYGSGWDNY